MSLLRLFAAGSAAAMLLALCGLASDAQAADVSYSGTSVVSPYLGGSPYTFPAVPLQKFDLAGGCLTQVCVRLEGFTAGFASFENFQSAPARVNVTWRAKFDLLRPSLTTLLTVSPTVFTSDSVTAYDGIADYAGTSGLTHTGLAANLPDSVCLSSPADLALFTGPGTISLPITATNISSQVGANSWSFGIQAVATVKVTYTYNKCLSPAPPATWGQVRARYR